jgi:arylsulfatase A-like enzyme
VLFRNHYAQGAHTKASTASLFSGLFGFQHGVNWAQEMVPASSDSRTFTTQILDDGFETMAERMKAAGFRTFAVVKSQHLLREFGYSQGFDEYVSANDLKGDRRRTERTVKLATANPVPFFGYLHLAGVHHPFPEHKRHPAILKAYGFEYDEAARKAQGVDFTQATIKFAINRDGMTLDPDDVRFLNLIYDAELRTVDEEYVGKILDKLRASGRYDNTMILLTADHGEELYDHSGYAHGHALWDEVIHVPLLVKFPKGRKPSNLAREVDAVTQAIDLIPSLMSFLGQPAPGDLPGTDIFLGEPRGYAFSEIKSGYMMLKGGYKLIESNGMTFLANHREDPGETINLAEQEPERLAEMRQAAIALRQHVAIGPNQAAVTETELDEQAIEALKSLGYLQ